MEKRIIDYLNRHYKVENDYVITIRSGHEKHPIQTLIRLKRVYGIDTQFIGFLLINWYYFNGGKNKEFVRRIEECY